MPRFQFIKKIISTVLSYLKTIPGYGKAMVIDAPSSTVVTSSGVVLR